MRNKILLTVILILVLNGCIKRQSSTFFVQSKPFLHNLSYFDLGNVEAALDTLNWKIFIYLNARSNLTCFEDINEWRKLDLMANQYNGKISIWTNKNDSADVYWALKLEKITIPFDIIDSTKLFELGWERMPIHFKVLLNKQNIIYKTKTQIDEDQIINTKAKEFLKRIMFYDRTKPYK